MLGTTCSLAAPKLEAATIQVTTTADEPNSTPVNGNCTLREAFAAAAGNSAVDLCPAGSAIEPDVIQMNAGDYPWNFGYVFMTSVGGPIVFRGPQVSPPAVRIDMNPPASQRFMRFLSGDVTLENLHFRNGDVRTNQDVKGGGVIAATDTQDTALTLRNVWMTGNRATVGGAISYEGGGASRLLIVDSLFQANLASLDVAGSARGGALFLQLRGQACGQIINTTILQNRAESTFAGGSASAGGVHVGMSDQATLEIRHTTISYNEADAGPGPGAVNPVAAGLYLGLAGDSHTTIEDARLESNNLQGAFVEPSGTYVPSALDVLSIFNASLVLDRIQFIRNDLGESVRDLRIYAGSTGTTVARNILVAQGSARGALVSGSGSVSLAHWTVTGHSEQGLRLESSSSPEFRLDNSLLWNNGTDLSIAGFPAPIIDPSNLIGVNPLFVAPIADDYSLAAGSPAVDFGDKTLASMSRLDAAHAPRVDGADTDAGAYERGAIFGDGFEAGIVGTCQP
jgi:CSLREA domain-containing protein